MYDCHTIMKLLYPYLDGELDVKESLRVQAHLKDCQDHCREIFKQEKEFLKALKASASIPPAPVYIRERIERDRKLIESSEQREVNVVKRPRLTFPRGLLAATLAMLIMIMAGVILYALPKQLSKQVKRSSQELVKAAVENHGAINSGGNPCDIRSTNRTDIIEWIQQRVDFQVIMPQDEVSGMSLVCGKLVHLGDKKAALFWFESKEGKVSLLETSPQPFLAIQEKIIPFREIKFYLDKYRGYYALTWTDTLSYVLVSDQKDKIAEACRICHGGNDHYVIRGFSDRL